MADEEQKKEDAPAPASAQQPQGLNAPLNPHTGQANPAWQNILASAAGAMAGPNNPYMAELQKQQAAQQAALAQARQAQAQQMAAAHAAGQGMPAPPAHPMPAAGGLAGNPLAPTAVQQAQQMGAQGAQQLNPNDPRLALAAAGAPNVAMSDERIKMNVDRGGVERQMRRFLDSIGQPEPKRSAPSYDPSSLAGRALKNG